MNDKPTPPAHTPKSLRVARGMTQDDVAKAAKISLPTLMAVEGGESVNVDTLAKIAKALRVSLADLSAAWERARDMARAS